MIQNINKFYDIYHSCTIALRVRLYTYKLKKRKL